jgi:hypothetical protein
MFETKFGRTRLQRLRMGRINCVTVREVFGRGKIFQHKKNL